MLVISGHASEFLRQKIEEGMDFHPKLAWKLKLSKLLVLPQPCNLNIVLVFILRTDLSKAIGVTSSMIMLAQIFSATKNTTMHAT